MRPLRSRRGSLLLLTLVAAACSGGGGGGAAVRAPVPSAQASLLTADPLQVAADGTSATTIRVEVLDANGQPVAGRRVQLDVSGSGNLLTQPASLTGADGRTQATLASTTVEGKTVTAVVDPGTADEVALANAVAVEFVDPSLPLLRAARYEDSDLDHGLTPGDRVVVSFTTAVRLAGAVAADFDLPVQGDGFGTGATVQAGPAADEVSIVLGQGAVLRTRGAFAAAALAANAASGLGLAGGAGIVGAASGLAASAPQPVDLVPGFAAAATAPLLDAAAIDVGDVDRDGEPDVWVGQAGADVLLLGDGSGGLRVGQAPGSSATRAVLVRDLNHFGAVDVATAHANGVQIWQNLSLGGTLDLRPLALLSAGDVRLLLTADLDRDGFPDLVTGGPDGVRVWRNQRNLGLTFAQAGQLTAAAVTAAVLADVDGDRDPDLVVALQGQAPRILRNDGGLAFTVANQPLPLAGQVADLAAADLDGDGDVDLVAAVQGGDAVLLRNAGGFVAEQLGIAAERVRLLDLDGDSHVDLLAAAGTGVRLLANDGSGVLVDTGLAVAADDPLADLQFADLDGDGDAELLAATATELAVTAGSLTGSWGSSTMVETAALGAEDSLCAALGDLDGDGNLDLVAGNSGPDQILFGDGDGGFRAAGTQLPTGTTTAVAIGDIDGDGDLDVLTTAPANATVPNTVWINNGLRTFAAATTFSSGLDTLSLALGDVDGDGDLDVVLGNDGSNQLFGNETAGGVVSLVLRTGELRADPVHNAQQTNAVLLVDMDRDGDLDLLFGNGQPNSGQTNQLFRNSNGSFGVRRDLPSGATTTLALAAADVDGDGFVDVIEGNDGDGAGRSNRIVRGQASATFALATIPFADGVHATHGVAVADLDGDGDADLLTADVGGSSLRVWHNAGALGFTVAQRLGGDTAAALVAADLDGDGDVDAITANRLNQPNRVYRNR